MNGLLHWSYSMLTKYRECPFSVKLKYLEHMPEPAPSADGEAANERGSRIHTALEAVLMEGAPVPVEAKHFAQNLEDLRKLRLDPRMTIEVEKRTYFDSNWRLTDETDYWLVVVRDVFVVTPDTALTIDYKSGKRYGNEVKHFGQGALYSVAAWIEYPIFQEYPVELWYIDQKHIETHEFTPRTLARRRAEFDKEVEIMMSDKYFRPRANKVVCKYCPYSPRGTGACPVGV